MVVFSNTLLGLCNLQDEKDEKKMTIRHVTKTRYSLGMPLPTKTEVTTQEPETCCSGLREWNSLVTLAWLKKTCKLFKQGFQQWDQRIENTHKTC